MINLAEYADALKPFAVQLPLQGCDSGAILHVWTIWHLFYISHVPIKRLTSFLGSEIGSSTFGFCFQVTIQLLTSKTGFREFEQQRELRERGPSATPDHSSPDESSRCRTSPSDETLNHVDKVWSSFSIKASRMCFQVFTAKITLLVMDP